MEIGVPKIQGILMILKHGNNLQGSSFYYNSTYSINSDNEIENLNSFGTAGCLQKLREANITRVDDLRIISNLPDSESDIILQPFTAFLKKKFKQKLGLSNICKERPLIFNAWCTNPEDVDSFIDCFG